MEEQRGGGKHLGKFYEADEVGGEWETQDEVGGEWETQLDTL